MLISDCCCCCLFIPFASRATRSRLFFRPFPFPLMVVLLITGRGAGAKQGCKRYSWESRGGQSGAKHPSLASPCGRGVHLYGNATTLSP